MYFWTIIFSFLTIVTAIIGFLGIGFGSIVPAKIAFFVFVLLAIFSYLKERPKAKSKNYYQ